MLDLSDSSDATIFYQKDLYSTGFPMMESIRREGKLCDVTLTVGEHSLAAHRIVLAANIPYFRYTGCPRKKELKPGCGSG